MDSLLKEAAVTIVEEAVILACICPKAVPPLFTIYMAFINLQPSGTPGCIIKSFSTASKVETKCYLSICTTHGTL